MTNVLSSHRVAHSLLTTDNSLGPHLFDLNNSGPAISIPDQMQRGYYAVMEALDKHYIGLGRPLLVIGGGVAGVMAAMTGLIEGVRVCLVEKDRLFSTQASCTSRYVCPTQYDWPATHWRKGFFPHDGVPMSFSWTRGLVAGAVKDALVKQVNDFLALDRELFYSEFLGYEVVVVGSERWIKPKLKPPIGGMPEAFPMVLACAGFGCENTAVQLMTDDPAPTLPASTVSVNRPSYVGFRFWEKDDFEEQAPLFGMGSGNTPNIIISGSGDGALQDFLRIVVRAGSLGEAASAGALYSAFAKRVRGRTRRKLERDLLAIGAKFQTELETALSKSDQNVRRQYVCETHIATHAAYEGVIDELTKNTNAWQQITATLDTVLRNLGSEISVKLLHPCLHLTPYYGLNRFLVMLIGRYLKDKEPGLQVFFPETMLTAVDSTRNLSRLTHICGKPELCHDNYHQVFCKAAKCIDVANTSVQGGTEFPGGPFNLVIVRHGIKPKTRKDLLGVH